MKFEIDVRPSPSLAPPPLHSPRAPPLPQPPTSTWRNETRGGPVVPVDTRGRSADTRTPTRAHTHQTHVRPPGVIEPDRSGERNHILTKPTADDELDE